MTIRPAAATAEARHSLHTHTKDGFESFVAAAVTLVISEGNGACVVHGYNVGQRLSAGAPCARSATHVLLLLL